MASGSGIRDDGHTGDSNKEYQRKRRCFGGTKASAPLPRDMHAKLGTGAHATDRRKTSARAPQNTDKRKIVFTGVPLVTFLLLPLQLAIIGEDTLVFFQVTYYSR